MEEHSDKETLKALRESRRETIEKARQAIKIQNQDIKKIRDQLQSGPKTIPEIAGAIQMSPALVLRYISGLKKYGSVAEGTKEDDYFKYELAK
jgi:Fic family protein